MSNIKNQFAPRKAQRKQAKLRIGFAAPSGAGKTYSALLVARGIASSWDKVCIIDTEHGSAELYSELGDYNVITLTAKIGFQPDNYAEAIHAAEEAGMEVIIIDSLSHAWNEEGGLLDQADKSTSGGGNRFTVWAELTPQHRRLVNAMLQSSCHIIGTMRSKQEYAMEKDEKTGKSSVKKLGMAPVQRDGMEYEFTTFFDIDVNHHAIATKDRTGLFATKPRFKITQETGETFRNWNQSGAVDYTAVKKRIQTAINEISKAARRVPPKTADEFAHDVLQYTKLELKPENYEAIAEQLELSASEWKDNPAPKGPIDQQEVPVHPAHQPAPAAPAVPDQPEPEEEIDTIQMEDIDDGTPPADLSETEWPGEAPTAPQTSPEAAPEAEEGPDDQGTEPAPKTPQKAKTATKSTKTK